MLNMLKNLNLTMMMSTKMNMMKNMRMTIQK